MRKKTEDLLPLIKDRLAAANVDLAGVEDAFLLKLIDLYKVRLKTLGEFVEKTDCFFRDDFVVEPEGKRKYLESPENLDNLRTLADRLEGLPEFVPEALEGVFRGLAEERRIKPAALIHPARLAISGQTSGAGLFEMMELLGRDRVLKRLRGASR